jgi:hypothetical protein
VPVTCKDIVYEVKRVRYKLESNYRIIGWCKLLISPLLCGKALRPGVKHVSLRDVWIEILRMHIADVERNVGTWLDFPAELQLYRAANTTVLCSRRRT